MEVRIAMGIQDDFKIFLCSNQEKNVLNLRGAR